MSAPTKYCPDCKEHVPISQFHRNSQRGQATYCKQHWRARYQPLRTDNPEHDTIRAWAERTGEPVPKRGPLPQRLIDEYKAAHGSSQGAFPPRPGAPVQRSVPSGPSDGFRAAYGMVWCEPCGRHYADRPEGCPFCAGRVRSIFDSLRALASGGRF
jgi:hypothetical protein